MKRIMKMKRRTKGLLLFILLVVRLLEMGQITSPVGVNVFVIKGVARDIPLTPYSGV